MDVLLLLVHLATTLAMVGLIWFVQIVHYPLFGLVGWDCFANYERSHQRRTTSIVAPLMLTEATTAILLVLFRPAGTSAAVALFGVLLIGVVWASTFFWQVPAHQRLLETFDASTHQRLVRSNWVRTIAWTARGTIACWMCLQFMTAGSGAPALALFAS